MKIIYSFTKNALPGRSAYPYNPQENVQSDITHLFTIGEYYAKLSKYSLAIYALITT